MTTTQDLALLPDHECWALVRETPIGRLAVVADGQADIFPVNHVVDHGTVVIRTAAGTKLLAAVGHRVAFEADGYDESTGSAWSVVLKGRASEVVKLHDVVEAMALPLFPWHDSVKPHFVRVTPDDISGRRIKVPIPTRVPDHWPRPHGAT